MQSLTLGSSGFSRWLLIVLIAGLITAGSVAAMAKSPDDLDIITVSTRPDTVSGGNVLVRINGSHMAINAEVAPIVPTTPPVCRRAPTPQCLMFNDTS